MTKAHALRLAKLLALGGMGGVVVTYAVFGALLIRQETEAEPFQICCETPADWGLEYEAVKIDCGDIEIAGWYIPSRNRAAVILVHPGGGSRLSLAAHAKLLAERGYGIFMHDRRAIGESGGPYKTHGWLDAADIDEIVAWLVRRPEVDRQRLGIFGGSIGGQVALRAAASNPALKAVMADGPSLAAAGDVPFSASPSKLGNRVLLWLYILGFQIHTGVRSPTPVVDLIGEISPRPVFLIATEPDERWIVGRYFERAKEPKTLWEIPEAKHGAGWAARPEEFPRRLVEFFDTVLLTHRVADDLSTET